MTSFDNFNFENTFFSIDWLYKFLSTHTNQKIHPYFKEKSVFCWPCILGGRGTRYNIIPALD